MQLLGKGTVLNKRYSIEEAVILPERNYIVYLCTDINEKKSVAVKEFFPDYAQRGQDNSVIYSEPHELELKNFSVANALAEKYGCLPTIPAVSDIFEENNTCYAVCESFSGKNVSELIDTGKSFSSDSVRKMMVTLAKTAEAFEKVGISYSGFSPDEVWITSDGYIKLTDFEAMADKTKQNDAVKAILAVAYYMLTGEKALVGAQKMKPARKNLPGDMGKYIVGVLNGKLNCISASMLLEDINADFKHSQSKNTNGKEITVGVRTNSKSKKKTALVLCICGGLLAALCVAAGIFLWQGMASVTAPTTEETELVVDVQQEEEQQPAPTPEVTDEQENDNKDKTPEQSATASPVPQTTPQSNSSSANTQKSSGGATQSGNTTRTSSTNAAPTPSATAQVQPSPTASPTPSPTPASTPQTTAVPSASPAATSAPTPSTTSEAEQ